MATKGKWFESLQDIKAIQDIKTLTKEDFQIASESGKNNRISVFAARRSILRGIDSQLIAIGNFFFIETFRIFLDHTAYMECNILILNDR